VVPVVLNFLTKPFWKLPEAGVWMMPEGVTGRVEEKVLPVMKTASPVAAMEVAAVRPLPV
jgi:predicted NUDIX family NTP pyrophosphohydrolase